MRLRNMRQAHDILFVHVVSTDTHAECPVPALIIHVHESQKELLTIWVTGSKSRPPHRFTQLHHNLKLSPFPLFNPDEREPRIVGERGYTTVTKQRVHSLKLALSLGGNAGVVFTSQMVTATENQGGRWTAATYTHVRRPPYSTG